MATENTSALRELYPPIEPYETGRLKVSDIHEISYELCGNPNGKPVLVVHGGPGGGIAEFYRCESSHDPVSSIYLFKKDIF